MSDEIEKVGITYLAPDGSAVSPLADWPGKVTFPLVMTLVMHKRWQKLVNDRGASDTDSPQIGIAFTTDTEAEADERVVFVYDDVELALMFGKVELNGPDGKPFRPKSSDDLPLPVAVWLAKCYREWENSQVRFRWDGAMGLAASNGS